MGALTRAKITMRRIRAILACGVGVAVLLCSCGKTQEPPGQDALLLGDRPQGAPITAPASDVGILRDQTQYQPASPPTGRKATADTAADTDVAAGSGPAAAARQAVVNLLNDMESGEVSLILRAFDPAQVEALLPDSDFLYTTYEFYEPVVSTLAEQRGEAERELLSATLRKFVLDSLHVDPVNEEAVTITPNPLLVILGPERTTPTLTVAQTPDGWRIRLANPLTAEDVAGIRAFHERLQDALDLLLEALEAGEVETRSDIVAALVQAVHGRQSEPPPTTP